MSDIEVISSAKFSFLGDLHKAIHDEINKVASKNCLPIAAYIGVLEMVKLDLMKGD